MIYVSMLRVDIEKLIKYARYVNYLSCLNVMNSNHNKHRKGLALSKKLYLYSTRINEILIDYEEELNKFSKGDIISVK